MTAALRPLETLRDGFIASAAHWPNRPALLLGTDRWSYTQIDDLARRVATGLLTLSDAPKRVGILARRSLTSYTGAIAALLAGAAFVPLNPTLPLARLRSILDVAELSVILCEAQYLPMLGRLLQNRPSLPPVLTADGKREPIAPAGAATIFDRDDLRSVAPLRAEIPIAPDETAYLLFTSGSTGTPKGVPVSHANAASFLNTNLARYALRPDDILSQTFEQSFDLSVFDIFMAWSAGASLCGFTPTDLLSPLSVVQSHDISVWFSVPSMIAMQLRLGLLLPGSLPSLRLSLFCGEPLVREHAEAWSRAAPFSVLENLYGPTELTIACSAHRWNPRTSPARCSAGIVPIGRLYETLSSQIVNETLEPVAAGECGELCIAGPQTFAGYWRNSAASAAAFYDAEQPDGARTRFYRTGDLVRALPDGEMIFVGRRDHQIKLGGHRIELGEIESVLHAQPGVVEAAAFAWPPESTIAETIVAAVSGEALDGENVRARLRALLPAYMVPSKIHVIESMPRTSSGKLDRRALQERWSGNASDTAHVGA
ncbi:MAG: amino acid adenylation domain-containing protein [Sulfurifustaceae bacterium]